MKICFSYDHMFPAADRAGRHVETLIRRFRERGHVVTAISTPVAQPFDEEGVELLRLRETPGAKGHARRDTLLGKAITKFLRENDVQVLFAEGLTPLSVIAVKAAKRAGAACILRVLSDASGIVHSIGADRKLAPSALKKKVATMLGYADIAAASSQHCAELLDDYYDGPIRVIEKCVDLAVFNPERVAEGDVDLFRERFGLKDRPILLYAREAVRAETVAATLPLMKRIAAEKPELVFAIAGEIDEAEDLEAEIGKARLSDSYRLLGPLSQRDLCTAYTAARLYFAPLDSRASESELLEAMAMRCTVACYRPRAQAMLAVVGEDRALILEHGDPDTAAADLLALFDDDARLTALQAKAFAHARAKDIAIAVDRVDELCSDVLGMDLDAPRPSRALEDDEEEDETPEDDARDAAPTPAARAADARDAAHPNEGEDEMRPGSDGEIDVPEQDETERDRPTSRPRHASRDDDEIADVDEIDEIGAPRGEGDETRAEGEDEGQRRRRRRRRGRRRRLGEEGEAEGEAQGRDARPEGGADADHRDASRSERGSGRTDRDEEGGSRGGRDSGRADRGGRSRDLGADDDAETDEDVDRADARQERGERPLSRAERAGKAAAREERGEGPSVREERELDIDDVEDEGGEETPTAAPRADDEESVQDASRRLRELDPRLTLRDLMPFLRPPKHVFIMSLASASGQHRAGEAIAEAFRAVDQNLKVRQVNILEQIARGRDPEDVKQWLARLQEDETLFDAAPPRAAAAGEAAVEQQPEPELGADLFDGKLDALILDKRPHEVVLTHWLPLARIARLKREHDLRMKIAVVVTDFDLHRHWMAEGVDQYHVPSEKVRFKMVRAGVSPALITVTGLPVHPRFEEEIDRDKVRADLGVKGGQPTILFRCAGMGSNERIIEMVRGLIEIGGPFNLLVLTGRDQPLTDALNELKPPRGVQLRAVGFVANIRDFMGASDLLITRAAGHTVAEAYAAGLSMVVVDPAPGVEERTTDWLVEQGVALKARDAWDLEWAISDVLKGNGRQLARMREIARGAARNKSGAASASVERICRELH